MRWMSTDVVRRAQGAFPECEQRPALKRTGRKKKKSKEKKKKKTPPTKPTNQGWPFIPSC